MALNPDPSKLDQQQIIQRVFDGDNDRLRVDASIEANIGEVTVSAANSDIAIEDRATGNLLKVNADGSIDVNTILDAATGDNVAISDGTNTLAINPDGSINVNFNLSQTTSQYNEVSSVPSSSLTTIITHTASVSQFLRQVDVSGTNIATYSIVINASTKDKRRTYFGSGLNATFEYGQGLPVQIGDVVTVTVIHDRPSVGDFNARLQFSET